MTAVAVNMACAVMMMMAAVTLAFAVMVVAAMAMSFVRAMMMFAVNGRVIGETVREEIGGRFVCAALHAAVKTDARFLQCVLCASADAAADQHLDVLLPEKRDERAVAGPVGFQDLRARDGPVRHLIELEPLASAKMLENLSFIVRDRYSHENPSFPYMGACRIRIHRGIRRICLRPGWKNCRLCR